MHRAHVAAFDVDLDLIVTCPPTDPVLAIAPGPRPPHLHLRPPHSPAHSCQPTSSLTIDLWSARPSLPFPVREWVLKLCRWVGLTAVPDGHSPPPAPNPPRRLLPSFCFLSCACPVHRRSTRPPAVTLLRPSGAPLTITVGRSVWCRIASVCWRGWCVVAS